MTHTHNIHIKSYKVQLYKVYIHIDCMYINGGSSERISVKQNSMDQHLLLTLKSHSSGRNRSKSWFTSAISDASPVPWCHYGTWVHAGTVGGEVTGASCPTGMFSREISISWTETFPEISSNQNRNKTKRKQKKAVGHEQQWIATVCWLDEGFTHI